MEEKPPVFYLCHGDPDRDAMQHAVKLKVWIDAERAAGRNPFLQGLSFQPRVVA